MGIIELVGEVNRRKRWPPVFSQTAAHGVAMVQAT